MEILLIGLLVALAFFFYIVIKDGDFPRPDDDDAAKL